MPKEEYFSRALYTVDIGQNDLTAGAFSNKSPDEFLPNTLAEFSRVIKARIYTFIYLSNFFQSLGDNIN